MSLPRPQSIPPIGLDSGVIKALLSEQSSERPSHFETAARIFLSTLVGKYEPPEELVDNPTDEDCLKYRWGHIAMDLFNRRDYSSPTAEGGKDGKRIYDGRRSAFIKKLLREGRSEGEARSEAWLLFPAWDSCDFSCASSSVSPVISSPACPNAPEAAKKAPLAASAPSAAQPPPPAAPAPLDPVVEREAATLSASALARKSSDEARREKWEKKFPTAEAFREYILSQLVTRLDSQLLRLVKEDPNASADVLMRLRECGWKSTKTERVFRDLFSAIPYMLQSYLRSKTQQEACMSAISQMELEANVQKVSEMDSTDLDILRARRWAAAEKAEMEQRKKLGWA